MPTQENILFPPVRACIFDMDGLLIDSEDVVGQTANQLLQKYGRPLLTSSMRAQLMGVPGSTNSDMFHDWAKLLISREQWDAELQDQLRLGFQNCEPLPGAETILSNLNRARCSSSGDKIELALASTTSSTFYEAKTSKSRTKQLLDLFQPENRVLGDDPRLLQGRTKPAPDIYLIALHSLNATKSPRDNPIKPNECLVFEDSIVGVEAGRRAGMRVVWVPHPALAEEYQARDKDVLAGRMGTSNLGDEWQLGEIDDGWAESIKSLVDFDYSKYGIYVSPSDEAPVATVAGHSTTK